MKNYDNSLINKNKKKYLKRVVKELDWCNANVFGVIMFDCWNHNGDYEPKVRYAGSGDSSDEDESLTSKLVPEFNSNFVFCIHDYIYSMIERRVLPYDSVNIDWRKRADELMEVMMRCNEPSWLCKIYYRAVRMFGRV